MTDTIIYSLPEAPLAGQSATHWWRIADGAIVETGSDADWPTRFELVAGQRLQMFALAPIAAVRLAFTMASATAASPRQAAAIARVEALEHSIGDPGTLHIVSALPNQDGIVVTATVANGEMLNWLDWSKSFGVNPDRIVPVATLLPLGELLGKGTDRERNVGRTAPSGNAV